MDTRRRRWLRCGRELVDGRVPGRGAGARVRGGGARGGPSGGRPPLDGSPCLVWHQQGAERRARSPASGAV